MHDPGLIVIATMHLVTGLLSDITRRSTGDDLTRDRGAVSIETVLWYAAAAVSVAVVAAIVWGQIKSTAGTGVDAPSAP